MTFPPNSRHQRRKNERGDASVEAVLVMPVLLLLIMLVINFALWYHASSVAKAGAQEGVRVARVVGGTAEAGQETAEQFLAQLGPRSLVNPVVTSSRNPVESSVEVSASSPMLIPGLSLPVRAVAKTPTESFRAAAP